MADVQAYFREFHEIIKLSYDDNALLRERRDTVLTDLKIGLRRILSCTAPKFTRFNQGSYALGTGIVPLDGDYDIDVGIVFQLNRNIISPIQIKELVYNALNTRNRTVYFMRPCIRVQYHENDFEAFHIDLAIYIKEVAPLTSQRKYFISKGLTNSKKENILWEPSEPFELLQLLRKRFSNSEDSKQFRRVIRYIKRWNDLNFYSDGHAKPRGITITALAYRLFRPVKSYSFWDGKTYYNDLKATRDFVSSIIGSFNWFNQISVTLPVKPHNDLFAKMTKIQMSDFKNRLVLFKNTLDSAVRTRSVDNACNLLIDSFGEDFPTPEDQ